MVLDDAADTDIDSSENLDGLATESTEVRVSFEGLVGSNGLSRYNVGWVGGDGGATPSAWLVPRKADGSWKINEFLWRSFPLGSENFE